MPRIFDVLWRAIALLICANVIGCASTRAGSAALTPQQSLAHGVEYLLSSQNPDGSWGSFDTGRVYEVYLDNLSSHYAFGQATSALCVMALLEPGRSDPRAAEAVRKGIEFLLTTEFAGRASGSTFYDTWAHTYMVHALSLAYQEPWLEDLRPRMTDIVRREIAILHERQGAEGGWGYYDFGYALKRPTGDQSTSFNTGAAIIALNEAQKAGFLVPQSMIDDGLLCLERLRLPSGAYIYGTYAQYNQTALYNYVKGSLGRSQPCNLALFLHARGVREEDLVLGLWNLREHHHFIAIGKGRPMPHEAWYATAGYYFMFGHYYAGLVINHITGPQREEYRTWLAETMAHLQDPDGAWFDFPLYGYGKAYGAAYGVLTLQACERAAAPALAGKLE